MATPVETPQPSAPAGGPESQPPAPEGGLPAGGAPVGTETPPQAPPAHGLPGEPAADGVVTSGRGSNQDRAPAAPETPVTPPAPPSPEGSPESPTDAGSQRVEDLPDWAQRIIKEARDDAAKTRVNAKQQAADEARKAMAEDIGRALGIITDDTPPEEQLNPDQLRDLLQGERTTARHARVELAVFKAAQAGGGFNAAALLDSRAFLDSISDVDPTDGEKLAEKIAEAVQANPWLAAPTAADPTPQGAPAPPVAPTPQQQPPAPPAPPAVPPSGGQFAGGPGAQPQDLSTMSIDDFRRLRRTPRS